MGNAQPGRVVDPPQHGGDGEKEAKKKGKRHGSGAVAHGEKQASGSDGGVQLRHPTKASGRRAQKLQKYSTLTMSKLVTSSSEEDNNGTATTATTAETAAAATATGQTTAATTADSPSPQHPSQAEAVEDEMALVKGFLAQSQKMGVTPSASVTSPVGGEEEQAKDMCLLCEREFVVAGKSFYVLELCGHGYCVECLYHHLQAELTKRESESGINEDSVARENKDEKVVTVCVSVAGDENSARGEADDKGKEKEADAGEEAAAEAKEKPLALSKHRDFTCPLESCKCVVSVDDLKQGLAVFGKQGPSFVSAHPGHSHLKQSLPSKLSASLRVFIESNESFIMCPKEECGVAFERLPPSEEEKRVPVKDDEGKAIVGPALAHYHEYRFRCRVCDTIFCSACTTAPYHAGYTCQQYQMYGRYKHCIICDMPVKKDEQKAKEEEEEAGSDKGKEKEKEKVDQDILDDAAAILNIEAPSDLSISGHMAAELADALLSGAEEPPSGEEVASGPATVESAPDEGDQPANVEQEQKRKEEEAKADEQACDNGGDKEQQKAEKVEKGKEKADDDDEGEVEKKPEHEAEAEVDPAKEARDVLRASSSSSDESVASEIGAEGLLAAFFLPEEEKEVKGKRGKKARRPLKRSSDSASDESSEISEVESCSESETEESETGSETESASDSDDEHVVQPPPHVEEEEPEELNYDDILGGDDLDPAPIQAFAKDIPRVPGGIFFWRKRRVRKVRDELVLEKEAWDRQEMERFLKEQDECNQKKEILRKEIEAKKQERAELETAILEHEWCGEVECRKAIKRRCFKHMDCNHQCYGLALERECLHCIHPDCVQDDKQTKDDYCNICWVEGLGAKPCISLTGCGHLFHYDCAKKKLTEGWPTAVISFAFMDCPLCNVRMDHPSLQKQLKPLLELEKYVTKAGVERIAIEGMKKDDALVSPHSPYFNNPEKFAADTFAFYMCYRCRSPYFGGKKECANMGGPPGAGAQGGAFNPKELVCGACSNTSGQTCLIHGEEYMEWKCRFCCRLATYFCAGKARFCDPCHGVPAERVDFNEWKTVPEYLKSAPKCNGPSDCPLGVYHPPNGTEEFCLGCVLCRAIQSDSQFQFKGLVSNA